MLKQAGEKTFKKDKRINIRLSSHDLIGIQRLKEFLIRHSFPDSIHQYVEGDLVEESQSKYGKK